MYTARKYAKINTTDNQPLSTQALNAFDFDHLEGRNRFNFNDYLDFKEPFKAVIMYNVHICLEF